MSERLRSIPFGERAGGEPYNASEVLALADSRFLFCDNNVSDSLFEFRVRGDGTLGGRLRQRRIEGLAPGAIDDLEGIEIVRVDGRTYIYGTSSLCLKTRKGRHRKKKRGKVVTARESIVRITVEPRGRLRAEVMPDFRPWLIEHTPWLRRAARLIPDDGGSIRQPPHPAAAETRRAGRGRRVRCPRDVARSGQRHIAHRSRQRNQRVEVSVPPV